MKNVLFRKMSLPAYALIAVMIAGGNPISALTQDSEDRMIDRAQRAVRQQIIRQEGGRNLTVSFNTDAQADSRSRTGVRVRSADDAVRAGVGAAHGREISVFGQGGHSKSGQAMRFRRSLSAAPLGSFPIPKSD
jgi:hypothetical protein